MVEISPILSGMIEMGRWGRNNWTLLTEVRGIIRQMYFDIFRKGNRFADFYNIRLREA